MRCGTRHNPASPLNVHKDGSTVRVQVESVSFFKRASGVTDLAQVRYLKAERAGGGAPTSTFTHWIATIQYAYAHPFAGSAGATLESRSASRSSSSPPNRKYNGCNRARRGG